eukprot:5591695-Prymnesium_polylepis.2
MSFIRSCEPETPSFSSDSIEVFQGCCDKPNSAQWPANESMGPFPPAKPPQYSEVPTLNVHLGIRPAPHEQVEAHCRDAGARGDPHIRHLGELAPKVFAQERVKLLACQPQRLPQ